MHKKSPVHGSGVQVIRASLLLRATHIQKLLELLNWGSGAEEGIGTPLLEVLSRGELLLSLENVKIELSNEKADEADDGMGGGEKSELLRPLITELKFALEMSRGFESALEANRMLLIALS